MDNNTKAVIDIGSNSVRLLLSDGSFSVTKKDVITTQLAEGLGKSGFLNSEKIVDTVNAVSSLFAKAKTFAKNNIFIFATQAVRAAKNGHYFSELVKELTGVDVDVISGALEGTIGFLGATLDLKSPSLVVDVGGASVEITGGENGVITYKKSLPIGMVVARDILKRNNENASDFFKEKLKEFGELPSFENLVFIGGTATSIASMLLNQTTYDETKTHGFIVKKDQLIELREKIKNMSADDITKEFKTINKMRASIIYCGVAACVELLNLVNRTEFRVSELDNLEGYLMYKTSQN